MDDLVVEGGAFAETVVLLSYIKDLPDVRQRGKVMYPLAEVMLRCHLPVLTGGGTVTDIARFGEKTRSAAPASRLRGGHAGP